MDRNLADYSTWDCKKSWTRLSNYNNNNNNNDYIP